jgi:hypothetical protein
MAVAAEIVPTWAMTLFRPMTCLDYVRGERRGDDSYDLSLEHVIVTGTITWRDFCRFLGYDKFIWMGPSVYVCDVHINHPGYRLVVQLGSLNSRDPLLLRVCAARETAAMTVTCDFAVCLLANSKEPAVTIKGRDQFLPVPLSGPGLLHLFQESQGNLRKVILKNITTTLNEEHIRALATASEPLPEMEVILDYCSLLDDPGCHGAFVVECLQPP